MTQMTREQDIRHEGGGDWPDRHISWPLFALVNKSPISVGFESGSLRVAQGSVKVVAALLIPSGDWEYQHVPQHQAERSTILRKQEKPINHSWLLSPTLLTFSCGVSKALAATRFI